MFFKVFIESILYFYIMCYIPLPLFQLEFSSVIKIWDKSAGLLDALNGEGSRLLGSIAKDSEWSREANLALFHCSHFKQKKNEKLFPQRSHEHVLIISKKNAASSQTNIPHAYHWGKHSHTLSEKAEIRSMFLRLSNCLPEIHITSEEE